MSNVLLYIVIFKKCFCYLLSIPIWKLPHISAAIAYKQMKFLHDLFGNSVTGLIATLI